MPRIRVVIVALLCWGFSGRSGAHAQIDGGNVRLFIDAGLVNWKNLEERYPAGDKEKYDTTLVALLGNGGLGVSYAANRFLIPGLYLSLQHAKLGQDEFKVTTRQWELRPALEVALLPSMRSVPFVAAGLSLQRRVVKSDDSDDESTVKSFGLGPAVGVGLHGFVLAHASLDLSLTYRATFFGKGKVSGPVLGLTRQTDSSREHAILLNLGASFWL